MFAKKLYKLTAITLLCFGAIAISVLAKNKYSDPDFGKTFDSKSVIATKQLAALEKKFTLCNSICNKSNAFMQSIVFAEVMRFSQLKDDIETESLRTLYVQLGEEYANFSIGLFQMKPSFAAQVEEKAKQLLPDSIYNELQLAYTATIPENIRTERVERLQDADWQLIYLTAFICICNVVYKDNVFTNDRTRLQWYATVYNAGFDKSDVYITQKIDQDNFYLSQHMPGKKFKYAAIAAWYFIQQNSTIKQPK
ncbi:MAG: hypothetical protein ACKVOW_00055 [Chitinophagaceae bacterium]